MSTFPLNYDKRHWTIHYDLFILIIKTVVKTPFFFTCNSLTAPCFVPSTLSHLRRFGLRGFLRRLSKGPEVDGWFMGYFCDQLWVQKWWIWFGKGTWLSQLCCESGGGICHEVYGFFRNSFCRNQNPFCYAVQQQSLRKHEVLLCLTGSDCHHVIKNRDRQRCWCIAKILSRTCANCWQVWQVHLWQPP